MIHVMDDSISILCHVLYCCINLLAIFILTLLIHIIITSCSVVVLLHFVQFLSLLYSWCIMGVFVLHIFMSLYYIYYWQFEHPIWLFLTLLRIYWMLINKEKYKDIMNMIPHTLFLSFIEMLPQAITL
jgi:hypothetical protein